MNADAIARKYTDADPSIRLWNIYMRALYAKSNNPNAKFYYMSGKCKS